MIGTMNDSVILQEVINGNLIVEDFDNKNIKQACYEVRVGNVYFDLKDNAKKYTVEDKIIIKPHQSIVIISKEKFKLPKNVLARFVTKGALVSIGLSPICTYADPGFIGHMGFIINNISNHYIKLFPGDSIAKVTFEYIVSDVKEEYKGQHGFETGIWPIKTDYIMDQKEVNASLPKKKRINEVDEIENAFGENVAKVFRRILVSEKRFLFSSIVIILMDLIIIGLSLGTEMLSPLFNVLYGIIANALFTVFTYIIQNSKKSK